LDITPPLRLVAARRGRGLARQDAVAAQKKTLFSLVKKAADTKFGRDHDFASIASVADFQARVPLRPYDEMWSDYWKSAFPKLADVSWPGPTTHMALSSGTTSGKTKYLPITDAMRRSNARAAFDVLVHHFEAQPHSHLYGGKSFFLGGSTALTEEAPGIWSGDLSGIVAKRLPIWAKPFIFPDPKLALMSDWAEKVEVLAKASLDVDIRALTGTPSWVLVLLDRVRELRDARGEADKPVFPNLEMFVHGGVNFAPYRTRFQKAFTGLNVDMREVYAASEGFVASADRGFGEGLRMNVDSGLFYEFVPVEELGRPNPTRHWLANAETGVNYALVLATCAGVWGYVIGDTVRLTEKAPPRLLITGRTSYGLSAWGEHLIAEEIENGVADATAAVGAEITDYSVGALFKDVDHPRDGHLWVVEFKKTPSPPELEKFAGVLDETLIRLNDDYKVHRSVDFGIAPPTIRAVKPGTFAAWMKSRGKLGGQNKVPRVINDRELWENLRKFVEAK
jgi:GH3 auxin-responsive promoter